MDARRANRHSGGVLAEGWHRLFFVALDKTSAIPVWLPRNNVRFNFEDFGLEQAVGAIKARVQECGGIIEPMTALKRAVLYEEDKKYQDERRQISSYAGIEKVREKLLELIAEINRLCDEIRIAATHLEIGSNEGRCVIRNGQVSLTVGWHQRFANSTDGSGLYVMEFNAPTPLPNTREFSFSEPTKLSETIYLPDLSRAREYGWIEQHSNEEFLSSAALADRCVIQFLNLATRAYRGEIAPPSW